MKQLIEYYYNLKVDNINEINNKYYFTYNNDEYYFTHFFYDDINVIYEYIKALKNVNIKCHEIVFNNFGSPITKIDEMSYVLLKIVTPNDEINLYDMLDLNKKVDISNIKNKYISWSELWSKKIDYIESQINELKERKIINDSVDYYIGLAESAIYYVNMTNAKYNHSNEKLTISRKRVYYPNYLINYLNPLNFIIDLEVRDISEYLKYMFFYSDEDVLFELKELLKIKKLSVYSYNMLFARLLYPSYYFDLYEDVVNKNDNDEKLLLIINKVGDYESFLKKAYTAILVYAPLEKVDYFI